MARSQLASLEIEIAALNAEETRAVDRYAEAAKLRAFIQTLEGITERIVIKDMQIIQGVQFE